MLDLTNFAITPGAATDGRHDGRTDSRSDHPDELRSRTDQRRCGHTARALPPTGGSDANAFIAVTVLARVPSSVIIARKVRET